MATNITSTQLDFDNIKTSLKRYFAQQSEFSDYDFEASGLNNILDVLAYNTHFNGLVANFATNESFLNTAQLRSSVVSHAEALGYRPRSKMSANSTLEVSINLSGISVPLRPASITLPIGTTFTASNENGSYTFRTKISYNATDDGNGIYTFFDDNAEAKVLVYEGIEKTKTFFVDSLSENQVYVIPDKTIDTAIMKVSVFNSPTSSTFETYTFLEDAIKVDATTTYFDIKEAPNGYYELNFGDGKSFGKSPKVGSKIVVTYNSTSAQAGNLCSGFSAVADLQVNGVDRPILIGSQVSSYGGSDVESIESVRKLAPIQFSAQQRLVTAIDYKGMIESKFPIVEDVTVWGGEDNFPIDYGKVYISLKFPTGTSSLIQQQTKNKIKTHFTDSLAIMSIDNIFVEPEMSFLELQTNFYYNNSLTSKTQSTLENSVKIAISNHFTSNYGKFEKKFRRSPLLTEIDDLDKSILASRMDIKVQQRFNPALGQNLAYDINFPVALSSTNTSDYIISSSMFIFNGENCIFRNKLGKNTIEIFEPNTGKVVSGNIGEYDFLTGSLSLTTFFPTAIVGGLPYIKVSATPLDQGVLSPLRNFIFTLDESENKAFGNVETNEIKIVL
jgi:hypothetical protein